MRRTHPWRTKHRSYISTKICSVTIPCVRTLLIPRHAIIIALASRSGPRLLWLHWRLESWDSCACLSVGMNCFASELFTGKWISSGEPIDYSMMWLSTKIYDSWLEAHHKSAERNLFTGAIEMLVARHCEARYPANRLASPSWASGQLLHVYPRNC